MPTAAEISIRETLDLLDGPFVELAEGIAENRYALWLGSGISFSRMPGLIKVVQAVLDHLQVHADPNNETCAFGASLEAILDLAGLSPEDRARIDCTQPVATWPEIGPICQRLVLNYSRVLDQAPAGLDEDYLVWNAVDVVARYADPLKAPAAEHLAVAALAIEGVASDIATANWDGLVERAVDTLAGTAPAILQVRVRPEDVRNAPTRACLYKFHGCAVLAGQNEAVYRERIVGRASQINGWEKKIENRVFARKLIDMVISKPTLMLGLSAQDANIQTIFVAAKEDMAWSFPSHPPAFVFSVDKIGIDQRGLLQNVYRGHYTTHRAAIESSALLRAYARSLLPALWLYVVCAKLCAMIAAAVPALEAAGIDRVRDGLRALRNAAAASADPADHDAFLSAALSRTGAALTLFREGRSPVPGEGIYSPVSPGTLAATLADPGLGASGLRQFALSLGLLGAGELAGTWACTAPTIGSAAILIRSPARAVDVYFAANATAAIGLVVNGHVAEDQDAVVMHSQPIPTRSRRSPAPTLGRTGRLGLREINMAELADGVVALDDLLARLKAEMVL